MKVLQAFNATGESKGWVASATLSFAPPFCAQVALLGVLPGENVCCMVCKIGRQRFQTVTPASALAYVTAY